MTSRREVTGVLTVDVYLNVDLSRSPQRYTFLNVRWIYGSPRACSASPAPTEPAATSVYSSDDAPSADAAIEL